MNTATKADMLDHLMATSQFLGAICLGLGMLGIAAIPFVLIFGGR